MDQGKIAKAIIERLDKIVNLLERIEKRADKRADLKYAEDVKSGKITDTRCNNYNYDGVRCKSTLGHVSQHEY